MYVHVYIMSTQSSVPPHAYLVVCADGDLELRQNSLHFQLPLVSVRVGLHDLLWFTADCLLQDDIYKFSYCIEKKHSCRECFYW